MKNTLKADIEQSKFGTKNKVELLLRLASIENAVKDIIWMARCYANGRQTYAPGLFNDAYDILRSQLGDNIDLANAINEKHKKVYDISIEHTNKHPFCIYGSDLSSQSNVELKNRTFYKSPEGAD